MWVVARLARTVLVIGAFEDQLLASEGEELHCSTALFVGAITALRPHRAAEVHAFEQK